MKHAVEGGVIISHVTNYKKQGRVGQAHFVKYLSVDWHCPVLRRSALAGRLEGCGSAVSNVRAWFVIREHQDATGVARIAHHQGRKSIAAPTPVHQVATLGR
jgi:hypothetical protein